MSVWFFPRTHSADWAPIVTKFRPMVERSNYRIANSGPEFHVNFFREARSISLFGEPQEVPPCAGEALPARDARSTRGLRL
jgi:hypothetical protein